MSSPEGQTLTSPLAGETSPSEFELIQKYFSPLAEPNTSHIDIGLGDDCAVFSLQADERMAVSVDTLVAGVHFPSDVLPGQIASRAMAVSLSDLAAMGARPMGVTLAITVPESNPQWFADFSRGLSASLEQYAVPLLGGDTTRGPLSISVQVIGALPKAEVLTRSGAEPGDLLFVSGFLGDGAAALACINGEVKSEDQAYFEEHFYRPPARIELGRKLLDKASAAIDISDGLLADADHIAKASGVGIEVDMQQLPLSEPISKLADPQRQIHWALAGGDDYELCFTIPPEKELSVLALAENFCFPLTAIGRVVKGERVRCFDSEGSEVEVSSTGYQHFSQSDGL